MTLPPPSAPLPQVLLVGGVIVAVTWEENVGSASGDGILRQFASAANIIVKGGRPALPAHPADPCSLHRSRCGVSWVPALGCIGVL